MICQGRQGKVVKGPPSTKRMGGKPPARFMNVETAASALFDPERKFAGDVKLFDLPVFNLCGL